MKNLTLKQKLWIIGVISGIILSVMCISLLFYLNSMDILCIPHAKHVKPKQKLAGLGKAETKPNKNEEAASNLGYITLIQKLTEYGLEPDLLIKLDKDLALYRSGSKSLESHKEFFAKKFNKPMGKIWLKLHPDKGGDREKFEESKKFVEIIREIHKLCLKKNFSYMTHIIDDPLIKMQLMNIDSYQFKYSYFNDFSNDTIESDNFQELFKEISSSLKVIFLFYQNDLIKINNQFVKSMEYLQNILWPFNDNSGLNAQDIKLLIESYLANHPDSMRINFIKKEDFCNCKDLTNLRKVAWEQIKAIYLNDYQYQINRLKLFKPNLQKYPALINLIDGYEKVIAKEAKQLGFLKKETQEILLIDGQYNFIKFKIGQYSKNKLEKIEIYEFGSSFLAYQKLVDLYEVMIQALAEKKDYKEYQKIAKTLICVNYQNFSYDELKNLINQLEYLYQCNATNGFFDSRWHNDNLSNQMIKSIQERMELSAGKKFTDFTINPKIIIKMLEQILPIYNQKLGEKFKIKETYDEIFNKVTQIVHEKSRQSKEALKQAQEQASAAQEQASALLAGYKKNINRGLYKLEHLEEDKEEMSNEIYQELLNYINAKNPPSTAINEHYADECVTSKSLG